MSLKRILFLFMSGSLALCVAPLAAQQISGRVVDADSMQGLQGAVVRNLSVVASTTTDSGGDFRIAAMAGHRLEVLLTGFRKQIYVVKPGETRVNISIKKDEIVEQAVVIKSSRYKDKIREGGLTVESMGAQSIKETPASDFYEGLGHLRGVDVTAASLGFRIVNTRGFNSTSPVRSLQLIDGVDNQAPGLTQVKIGEREFGQVMVRYAKAYKNKEGRDVFAFKTGLSYMRAYDWVADNYDPTLDSKAGSNNPGGYDAVNRYGDEVFGTAANDQISMESRRRTPGLGGHYRDGYAEKDLVDYNTRNLKTNILLAYKPNEKNELQYAFNFGTGTTVYQGDNRYSLKDILFFQNRLEWSGKKGHLRLYATNEDAGNTYDAVLTAFLMQNEAKPGALWFADYQNYWLNNISGKVRALPGYNQLGTFVPGLPNYNPNWAQDHQALMDKYADSLNRWHAITRAQSNKGTNYQNLPYADPYYTRLTPGTPEFDAVKDKYTSAYSYNREGGPTGSRFYDRSALYHITGERRYFWGATKITTGFSARLYRPNSNGTIFLDTGNVRIQNAEAGMYAGFERKLWDNRWKINAAMRVDKNQNFPVLVSPAASLIYTRNKNNTWRAGFSSAIRNPTLQDQFLFYNVGRAILLGNKDGIKNVVELDNFVEYLNTPNLDRNVLRRVDIPAIRPESVRTFELGYKGVLLDGKLMVDAGYYYSFYKNFIGIS